MMHPDEIQKHITDIDNRLAELQQARTDALDTIQQVERTIIFLSGKREVFQQLLPNEQAEKPGDGDHDR